MLSNDQSESQPRHSPQVWRHHLDLDNTLHLHRHLELLDQASAPVSTTQHAKDAQIINTEEQLAMHQDNPTGEITTDTLKKFLIKPVHSWEVEVECLLEAQEVETDPMDSLAEVDFQVEAMEDSL